MRTIVSLNKREKVVSKYLNRERKRHLEKERGIPRGEGIGMDEKEKYRGIN